MAIQHFNYFIEPEKIVGAGKFGYVQKVVIYNRYGHRCGEYARKVFHPEAGVNILEFKKRFKFEVTCQASCVHSNIAPIYLYDLKCEEPWFVMELAEHDLCEDIDNGNLTSEEKLDVILMVLSAVDYMHSEQKHGMIKKGQFLHRDIKPSNILKCSGGNYKISDFGLVKNVSSTNSTILTTVATTMGTSDYMAPEVRKAGYYSAQSDIYSLGVLIDDLALSSDISGIDDVVAKCTSFTVSKRYRSVRDVVTDVASIKKSLIKD